MKDSLIRELGIDAVSSHSVVQITPDVFIEGLRGDRLRGDTCSVVYDYFVNCEEGICDSHRDKLTSCEGADSVS